MSDYEPIIKNPFRNVYSPSDDTFMILDYLKKVINNNFFDDLPIQQVNKCLDLGTGTGIIAIFLACLKKRLPNFKSQIFASDILSNAIKCAINNEKINSINEKIEFIKSDLFAAFPDELIHSFDIIIFNPPYLPSIENSNIRDQTWDGGETGIEILIRFIEQVDDFLSRNGIIYFVNSSNSPIMNLNKLLKSKNYKIEVVDKIHYFFEDIILNKIKHNY